jgi:hypothetical protein
METLPQTRRLDGRHRMPGIVACRCACTEKPTTELDNRPHRSSFYLFLLTREIWA